jgi:signal transduction histidine kinase
MNKFSNALQGIIKGLKSNHGKAFFHNLTMQLHQVINADYIFISKLDSVRHVSRTISLVAHGEIADNFEYSLVKTPCDDVSNDGVCIYPENICKSYPEDQLLVDMNIEGYIGAPLFDSAGKVMGIVAAMYETKIEQAEDVAALFELFSGRISAEIEREEKEAQLQELNIELENKVEQRTLALSKTLNELTQTQNTLIEQEKMASLGKLVAGVAHEINTPLGVALLSSSTLNEKVDDLFQKMNEGSLTKSDLMSGFDLMKESNECLTFNLQRAASLVSNFKQVAIDRNTQDIASIDCHEWFNTLISSLRPMLKQKNIEINVAITENNFSVNTYPSYLSQIITNLVSNSENHAFEYNDEIVKHKINLTINNENGLFNVIYSDNGKGMTKEIKEQVFEPFFTTKRGQGGTGLGLSIVKNLILNTMEGKISLDSAPNKGTTFNIALPSL